MSSRMGCLAEDCSVPRARRPGNGGPTRASVLARCYTRTLAMSNRKKQKLFAQPGAADSDRWPTLILALLYGAAGAGERRAVRPTCFGVDVGLTPRRSPRAAF